MKPDLRSSCFDAAIKGDCGALLELRQQHGVPCAARFSSVDPKRNGFSALHFAALHDHADAVALLVVRCGAAVDAVVAGSKTVPGPVTALHVAAQHGRTAAAVALVDAGASLDLAVEPGLNALTLALQHGHLTTAAVLLRHTPLPDGAFTGPAANPALCSGGTHGHIKALPQHERSCPLWQLALQESDSPSRGPRTQREGQWRLCAHVAVLCNMPDLLNLLIDRAGGKAVAYRRRGRQGRRGRRRRRWAAADGRACGELGRNARSAGTRRIV